MLVLEGAFRLVVFYLGSFVLVASLRFSFCVFYSSCFSCWLDVSVALFVLSTVPTNCIVPFSDIYVSCVVFVFCLLFS